MPLDPSPHSPPEASESAAIDPCIQLLRLYAETLRRIDARFGIHGLSFGDFAILYHLQRAPELRLRRTDLAALMGVTASAVTRSLLPLEKIGLVDRQSHARDARVSYACLTPTGQRLFADACATAEIACRDALQDMAASAPALASPLATPLAPPSAPSLAPSLASPPLAPPLTPPVAHSLVPRPSPSPTPQTAATTPPEAP